MPQIRSKQILGETPTKPTDLTTKAYVDSLIGSGGTSSPLTIQDENNVVMTGVTIINFLGVDVVAMSGGTNQVNVWIPMPVYAPNFNTAAATVSSISTASRNISAPTVGTFNIGNWTAGTVHNTIRNSATVSYNIPAQFNVYNLTTTFTATLFDADGTTVLGRNIITPIGNTSSTVQNITITISNWGADADRYKCQINVSYNMNALLPQGGRFSISLVHVNGPSGTFTFTQNDVFRDTENLTANLTSSTLTVVTGTTVVTKLISGVKYYTLNTQWHVHIDNIDNLNSRSYPTTQQLNITESNLFISTDLSANGNNSDFVGGTWTNAHNSTQAVYDKPNWTTDQINNFNWNNVSGGLVNTNATATIYYNWSLTDTKVSSNYNYLIDTLVDSSSRNSEMFRTENVAGYPRLSSDLVTPWDNTQSLTSFDGGTGLQLLGDRLVYPQYNFQPYEPGTVTQPNYTGLSGDKYYYRQFDTDGNTAYNGIIQLLDYNITESDLTSGIVKFEVSTDGLIWLDCSLDFSLNLNGCRAYADTYALNINNQIWFTFNNVTPNYTTSIYFKITYTVAAINRYIGGIDIISTYWV